MSRSTVIKGAAVIALAGALGVAGASTAFAASASKVASSSEGIVVDNNLLTTMGARAGSAGPDFLGISNMNYDFQPSHTAGLGDPYPYYKVVEGATKTGYKADVNSADQFNRLAIWGTGVNTNANPYYQNILAQTIVGGTTESSFDTDTYTIATTYHSNQNSWGDVVCDGSSVINENYEPDIIFGANKYTNWAEGDYATGTYAAAAADAIEDYDPTYANNDATNIWTQIYSMEQLARTADTLTGTSTKYTRYGNSTDSALAYEKAIKGQMLYCASEIEQGTTAKKKVAYLYAIDSEAGKAYFFVPTAEGLADGYDTGAGVTTGQIDSPYQDEYAANNSTINMGYMATLPFITDTFGAEDGEGTVREGGIQMIVEDIYKRNPVVEVSAANAADCMADVDIIIYNSTKTTGSMVGTNNGKCVDTDINNTAALTDASVAEWAAAYGFTGDVLAGDDYGTSTQQNAADTVGTNLGSAPILYCARNYTCDKNARAAWAFSKVYPELYDGNDDASYAYWLANVYHIQTDKLTQVTAAFTHQSADTVNIGSTDCGALAEQGKDWYDALSEDSIYKTDYAYYNGSSRASYYAGTSTAEEPTDTIGIFAPSKLWSVEATANASVTAVSNWNQKAYFTCETDADGATYQWQWSKNGKTWKNCTAKTAQNQTMMLYAYEYRANYQYRCIVTVKGQEIATSNTVQFQKLTVNATTTPVAKSGDVATFSASVDFKASTYQWQYRVSETAKWRNCTTEGCNAATMNLAYKNYRNGYQYRCKVTTPAGLVVTSAAVDWDLQ